MGIDTGWWREDGRDEGGPESSDSSFSSAVPDGGHRAGRLAGMAQLQTVSIIFFFYQQCVLTLSPFLHGPLLAFV